MPSVFAVRRAKASADRANFEKEEDLARQKRGMFGQDLVLGEGQRGKLEGKERVISARAFGPALRGERPVKRKKPYGS